MIYFLIELLLYGVLSILTYPLWDNKVHVLVPILLVIFLANLLGYIQGLDRASHT